MMERRTSPSLDAIQTQQINDWLKQSDKYIREGRYLAADELLQKVFAINPSHEVARSYQDRIDFLIKQLSQRVGLTKEVHTEITRYREALNRRKPTDMGAMLVLAQRLLDQGAFRKAAEQAGKVLSQDPNNAYAKALVQRIDELERSSAGASVLSRQEQEFTALLKEQWKGGSPAPDQAAFISERQKALSVTDARKLEIEREVKNVLYLDALRNIWFTGGLAAFTHETLDQLRGKFEISRIDHSVIETSLLREMRRNKIKGTVLIVEGNEEELLSLTQLLRSNFYAIFSASSVEEALASIKSVIPDCVISAMQFDGGISGFELFQSLRSNTQTRHVPFIFAGDSIDRTTQLIGKRLGVDEFMTKPVDTELLLSILAGKIHRAPKSTGT